MSRQSRIPPELTGGPFTVETARSFGVELRHLHDGPWRRIAPSTYVWKRLQVTPEVHLEAALLRLPERHAFSGYTAAWLHGLDITPGAVEVIVPKGVGVSGRASMRLSRAALPAGDVTLCRGYRTTSVERTLCDLARRTALTEAVTHVDAALHAGLTSEAKLAEWLGERMGRTGRAALARALAHAEAASESPMEMRLRLLLVLAGLPRPEAQVSLTDNGGRFLGRVDLYYRASKLGIEYDGAAHRESLVEDNRRQNRLVGAGVTLLRFTHADIRDNPHGVVRLVATHLAIRRAA